MHRLHLMGKNAESAQRAEDENNDALVMLEREIE